MRYMPTITVTDLNNQIKTCLETTFLLIDIHGEVSNLTHHRSGHSYFHLKDEFAYIRCVLYKGNKSLVKLHLEEGQKVHIKGAVTVYSPRGEYQVVCKAIELYGTGDLYIEYERLKKELSSKGYFAKERKKPLPQFVDHIVVITSASGAVIEDIKRVATKRWALSKITLIDTIVQGVKASSHIINALQQAHDLTPDVIILARGGGSIEDLWCFNDRSLADVIYNATVPIISAIGHESDFLISDFVADVRAPTPSAAMELLLPDVNEYAQYLDDLHSRFTQIMQSILHHKQEQIDHIRRYTKSHIVSNQFDSVSDRISELKVALTAQMRHIIQHKQDSIPNLAHLYQQMVSNKLRGYQQKTDQLKALLEQHNPQQPPTKGKAKILKNNHLIALKDINIDDVFSLQDQECQLQAKALSKS